MSGRKMIVGGNWKCNLTTAGAAALVEQLNAMEVGNCEVYVAPVAIHIPMVLSTLKTEVASVACQNCNFTGTGAYTGEISAEHLVDMSIPWVILGHSERRQCFKEDDEFLAKKLAYALSKGLKVVFCIGELKEQREDGTTMEVCKKQLVQVAKMLDPATVVIAYEPVWAIGTGLVATPEQAQETQKQIREYIAEAASPDVAAKIRIQYGGSVNGKNCAELAALPDIDGFLVGGASLKPEFTDIVKACSA
ncbi:triose-phosphate isomerase [Pavlovales sp. CCMP2436]|nr:triose-phosphate isomerase [Pavlovales sp. CCMP2436]|eukprot:CAMPEP_0179848782 /NCGR_PEP_ID=MMETSP0982-20121206/6808_1 /TAXON_ID=483367 /ORGANISM="non described non described, Strain CCMP 2436" /LENGTH=248 /DNA_ID=CAMNT_0021734073 /DNA_START=44 /DNA_END=790 /DNA_ORIENTATION=+